jgi:hypothetical protein
MRVLFMEVMIFTFDIRSNGVGGLGSGHDGELAVNIRHHESYLHFESNIPKVIKCLSLGVMSRSRATMMRT